MWGEDGKQKTRGQAERLDHTHTSKDLSCSEVMHVFFLVGFSQHSLKRHQHVGRDGTNATDSMGQIQVIKWQYSA